MAVKYGYLDTDNLDKIGAAIREKNGETDKYTISQMPDKIRAIETTPTPSTPVSTTINPGESTTIPAGYYEQTGSVTSNLATTDSQIDDSAKETKTVTAPLKNSIDVTPSENKVLSKVTVNAPDMSQATVTTANLVRGVTAYDSTGSLITGTHDEATLQEMTADATASESDLLPGKTAYANGAKITGTMSTKDAATYNPSDSDQIISGGQYLNGTQTIAAVTSDNIPSTLLESQTVTASLTGSTAITPTTGKVLTGVTVNAPDMSSADATADDILNGKKAYGSDGTLITGTGTSGIDTSDATAESTDIVKGKTAYVNGEKITGVLESITVYTSTQVPSSTEGNAGDICIITS